MARNRLSTALALLVGVALFAAAAWFLFRPPADENKTSVPESAQTMASTVQSLGPPDDTPAQPGRDQAEAEVHPVDPRLIRPSLPSLQQSDPAAWSTLTTLFNPTNVLDLVVKQQLIQRAVTLIDGLTQAELAPSVSVLRPVAGELRVAHPAGGQTVISLANAQRYAPYVNAFVTADAQALVGAYRAAYPLFQAAYVELGYPQRHFNDRLIQVIDHLLQTPAVTSSPPVRLNEQGQYEWVDQSFQKLSIGQKTILRLSPDQANAVKQQLRHIRAALMS